MQRVDRQNKGLCHARGRCSHGDRFSWPRSGCCQWSYQGRGGSHHSDRIGAVLGIGIGLVAATDVGACTGQRRCLRHRAILCSDGRFGLRTAVGQDATVFRWESKDDVISGPRCIYARDIIDWANDPVRFGVADPLGEHHFDDDPFHEDTDFCRGCTFSFTITYKNEREVAQLPWDDTPPGDPPEGDGPLLSCENLREWASLPEPDATASGHIGYGFNPTLGDPTDPTSGALMLWDMFNGAWVPLTYDAHFSEGTLTWSSRLRSYTVTY